MALIGEKESTCGMTKHKFYIQSTLNVVNLGLLVGKII